MADFTDPSSASLRLSNDERERAVAALQSQAAQGRLTDEEAQARTTAARAAVTRGDLAPLFADLPGGVQLDPHPRPQLQPDPAAAYPGPQQYPAQPDARAWDGNGRREPASRWGLLAVSIIPFVSVILFFLTGMVWGYQYSWLWFLLIPLVGAITYGTDAGRRR
ncbi:hypothetical protein A0130_02030 [Leifsonia xyli]|uniref:DUF1707 SHOCT-like domain-containing protein n=1 Tax=Leifsonia xyli TaxID=1575 RepID=UPI0007CDE25E|nr:hypothetical protein A0130_02030 [Leifsonia xyli]